MPDNDLRDDWRMSEVVRTHAYEPPVAAIDDYSGDCVCLRINSDWIPYLTGVVNILRNPNLWVHEDADYAPNEIVKLIMALVGENPDMDCSEFITDISFDDGVLKITKGGVETEVAGTEDIVTGISAIGGGFEVEQGGEFEPITSDCADPCNEYPDKPAYDNSGELRSCNIATNLTEWVMEKYQDCLDVVDAAASTANNADVVLLLFPPAYLFWDAVNDSINEWFDMTIAIARALDTVGLREDMQEFLYCQLIANDHVMSEGIWSNFLDEFALIGDSIYKYLGAFKYEAIDTQAHKASYGEESGCETFECGSEQCIEYDFTLGDLGWTDYADAGRGHYNGTDAFESDTVSGTTRTDIVSPTFATPVDVVRVECDLDLEFGNDQNRYFAALDESGTEISNTDETILEDGTAITSGSDLSALGVYSIRVDFQTGTGFGDAGFSRIYKIRIYFLGTMPEWGTPC